MNMQTSFLRGHWESDWEQFLSFQFLSCLEKGTGEDLNSGLNVIEEHEEHDEHLVLRRSDCEVERRLTGHGVGLMVGFVLQMENPVTLCRQVS